MQSSYFKEGNSFFLKGDYEKAVGCYRKAITQSPVGQSYYWYYDNLIKSLLKLDCTDEAKYWAGLAPQTNIQGCWDKFFDQGWKNDYKENTEVSERKKVVFSVTTYNRVDYVKECLSSFLATRDEEKYEWIVIIADDGSPQEVIKELESICAVNSFNLIKNSRRYCVGQTNTIFDFAEYVGFDFGFKCDDDVVFTQRGWDSLYIEAAEKTGQDHLCYLNKEHFIWNRKKEYPLFSLPECKYDTSGLLSSYNDVYKAMGALFTFTPKLLAHVGGCDEANFPIRGQWHIDFSIRCCRAGFNNATNFYDAAHSNDYVDLQNNIVGEENYECSIPWNDEYKRTKEERELKRRYKVIDDESRILINDRLQNRTNVVKSPLNEFFDRIFVLNLERRSDRWRSILARAKKHNIELTRFSAVDGKAESVYKKWQQYIEEPVINKSGEKIKYTKQYYLEYENTEARIEYITEKAGVKPIASAGALGYLLSMRDLLVEAREQGLKRILVLDDDAVFHKDTNLLFSKMCLNLPRSWKIFQLGALQYDWDGWVDWRTDNLYHCNGSSVASHAVGFDSSVFDELIALIDKIQMPFDEGALHRIKYLYKKDCVVAFPNLVIQDVSESDISTSMSQSSEGIKENNVYRWKLDDYRESLREIPKFTELQLQIDRSLFFGKKKHKLKVLHFRESFSAASETFIYDLIKNLDNTTNTDNYVVTFERLMEFDRPFSKVISLHGLEDKQVSFRDVIADIRPECIVSHFGTSAFELKSLLGAQVFDIPHIISMHGYDLYHVPLYEEGYSEALLTLVSSPNCAVTYPTTYVGMKLKEYLKLPVSSTQKMTNIGNQRFIELGNKREPKKSVEKLKILNVARLVDWKGHIYLLRSIAELKNELDCGLCLDLVGCKGDKREELFSLIEKLDIQNEVNVHGYLTNNELNELFQEAHVYVQPSIVNPDTRMTESFGVALLEAIYSGLPVVCTDAGGMPELIGEPCEYAKVVEQRSSEGITKAIKEFYREEIWRRTNNEYRRERAIMFSVDRQVQALLSAIARVGF